jgi:hypothetical protein
MLAEEVSLDETQAIAKIVRCLSLDNSCDLAAKTKAPHEARLELQSDFCLSR